jgi:hypothetical protein
MENTKYQLLNEVDKENDLNKLVAILELASHKLQINTISEMARLEGKSPNGIKQSNKYRKIYIGVQLMCVKGLDDNQMPF